MLIPSSEVYLLLSYIITIIVSIITAKALKLPMLPNKPIRYSFELSSIYPTPILAIGVFAILKILGLTKIFNEIIIAIIIGILVAFFTKYLFYYIFPKPQNEGDN